MLAKYKTRDFQDINLYNGICWFLKSLPVTEGRALKSQTVQALPDDRLNI